MWEFKALVGGLKEKFETAAEAGCMLAEILLAEPGWLGEVAKQMVYPPIGDFIPRSKDVLPLPVPADVLDFIRGGLRKQFRRGHGRQTAREKRDRGVLAWIFLVIVNLNVNWGGFGNARNALCVAEPSQAQQCTLGHVRRCAIRFVDMVDPESGALGRRDVKDWSEKLRSSRVNYKGETLEVALSLTLEETSPALPKGESASSVDVLTVCGPELGKLLADPSSVLLADDDIDFIPRARVNATDDEWAKICKELYRVGIVAIVPEKDILVRHGRKVVNGAFGVVKPKCTSSPPTRVSR
jgi:hypothetical protein